MYIALALMHVGRFTRHNFRTQYFYANRANVALTHMHVSKMVDLNDLAVVKK